MNYHLSNNGKTSGPFTEAGVRQMVMDGTASIDDLCWHEGLPNWVPLSQALDISPASVPPPIPILDKRYSFGGYAGFWLRFVASIIDGFVLLIPNLIIGGLSGEDAGFIFGLLVDWLYCALMESSQYQATLGKMALGLCVTDEHGNRVSFARASGRHFSKIVSVLTLFIGYMMAGWTKRKQALHDMMASCLVIRKKAW